MVWADTMTPPATPEKSQGRQVWPPERSISLPPSEAAPAAPAAQAETATDESNADEEERAYPRPRPSSQVLGSSTSTTTHLFILSVLIMLSFDFLNPVQRVCDLLGPSEWSRISLGWIFVWLLVWAVLQDLQNIIFYAGRVFFNSMLSIFISRIDVIGMENIPQHGPAILVANHFNQFIDGMCVMCACPQRRISFLIARKSYKHPIVGFFARAMAAVPVTRPQDIAFRGSGALLSLTLAEEAEARGGSDGGVAVGMGNGASASGGTSGTIGSGDGGDGQKSPTELLYRLVGSEGCHFDTELGRGDKLSFLDGRNVKVTWTWRVVSIESASVCHMRLSQLPAAPSPTASPDLPSAERSWKDGFRKDEARWAIPASGSYRVLPRGDYEKIFPEVVRALEGGACLGIFPEGGSHDRTDLLELKPGVSLLALGADLPVPIVPVGLSYFRGHLFRSAKVTVHVGPPILASREEKADHGCGGERRQSACTSLLARIERAMRDVIVPASSFEELQLVHVVRRLWCGPGMSNKLEPAVRQDLDRRFAFGIRRLLRHMPAPDGPASPAPSPKVQPTPTAGSQLPTAPLTTSLIGGGSSRGAADDGTTRAEDRAEEADVATELAELKAVLRERELSELVRRLRRYDQELRRLGLRDSQVPTLQRAPIGQTLFTMGHMLVMLLIASLPSVVLNAPVGVAAVIWAKWRQRAAVRSSSVKVTGHDVVLSEKMKFAMVGVPLVWLSYAVLALLCSDFSVHDVMTLLMITPVASYIGVISVESGMIALRDLRPMLARLLYNRKRVEALKREQVSLSRLVRNEIRQLVESDEVVRGLYHMRSGDGSTILSTNDWERVRLREARSSKEESSRDSSVRSHATAEPRAAAGAESAAKGEPTAAPATASELYRFGV